MQNTTPSYRSKCLDLNGFRLNCNQCISENLYFGEEYKMVSCSDPKCNDHAHHGLPPSPTHNPTSPSNSFPKRTKKQKVFKVTISLTRVYQATSNTHREFQAHNLTIALLKLSSNVKGKVFVSTADDRSPDIMSIWGLHEWHDKRDNVMGYR